MEPAGTAAQITDPPGPPADPTTAAAAPAAPLPRHIEAALRSFPSYQALYIDHQGGAYTPSTPVCVRGGAILYDNPFYKPLNTIP